MNLVIEKQRCFEDFTPQELAEANIMPKTGLATDYLNVFNEATMLFGLLADMPEMIDELLIWVPLNYEEHFLRSNFHAKEMAIEVYRSLPAETKIPFDKMSNELGDLIEAAIAEAQEKIKANENISDFCAETCFALQSAIMILDGMIHGKSAPSAQDEVDALFD